MLFEAASVLLASGVVQAVADAPAAIVDNAAVLSSSMKDLLSTPTNGGAGPKRHRLLQKLKKRKQRSLSEQSNVGGAPTKADVGVLSSNAPRFLEENDYDYYCPRDTCPDELCDCAEAGGSLEDCTEQLKQVCHDGKLKDCVFRDYVQVYEEVYCPFVACVGDGFRENQCDCAFYELYCNRLNSDECTPFQTDSPDKKPFFGCDETELASVCTEANSCKERGDLQGLDLGTWRGSVQTGIRNSGERTGGGRVAAGVALMSMMWLVVNI